MKNRKYLIVLLLLLVLFCLLYFFVFKKDNDDTEARDETQETENDTLTPEEVLENMDDEEETSLGENAELTIISPEEETFSVGQARMWQGEFMNISENFSAKAVCTWNFYMNDTLYRTMENSSAVSTDSPKVCTFTSTFIDYAGILDVQLSVDIEQNYEITDTYTAEREYSVL